MAEKISLADDVSAGVDKLYAKLGDRDVEISTQGLTPDEISTLRAKINGEVKGDHIVLMGKEGKKILARGAGENAMNDEMWNDTVTRAKGHPDYFSSTTGGVTHSKDAEPATRITNVSTPAGDISVATGGAEGPVKEVVTGPLERTTPEVKVDASPQKTGGTMMGRAAAMIGDMTKGATGAGGGTAAPTGAEGGAGSVPTAVDPSLASVRPDAGQSAGVVVPPPAVTRDAGVGLTSPPADVATGTGPGAPVPPNDWIGQGLAQNQAIPRPPSLVERIIAGGGPRGEDMSGTDINVPPPGPAAPAPAPGLTDAQRQANTANIMQPPPTLPSGPGILAYGVRPPAGPGGGGGAGFNYGAEQAASLAADKKARLENAGFEQKALKAQADAATETLVHAKGLQAAQLKADEEMQLSYKANSDKMNQLSNLMADAANQQIDPGRYWANKTAGQKAASLIAGACFGFVGQGMGWIQRLDGLVSEDMKNQAADRQAKMEGISQQVGMTKTAYDMARQAGMDHIGALKAAEASTWQNLAEQTKIIGLNAGSAMAKNNAMIAYQAVAQKALEKRGEYDNHARAVAVQEGHLALQRQMMGMKLAMLGMHPAYDKATSEEIDKLRDGLRSVGALKAKLGSGHGGWGSWGMQAIPGSDSANVWGGVREDMRAIDNALYGTAGNTSPEHTRILNETAGKDWREADKAKAWADEREQRLMLKLQDVMKRVQNPMGFPGSAGAPVGDILTGEESAE